MIHANWLLLFELLWKLRNTKVKRIAANIAEFLFMLDDDFYVYRKFMRREKGFNAGVARFMYKRKYDRESLHN